MYCVAFATEFVLHSIPYVRTICQRYRFNFYNAGMNFTFVKMAFDTAYALYFINFENGDQILSSSMAGLVGGFTLFYLGYISYHGGTYAKEIKEAGSADKVDSVRGKHIFVEYDPTHPTCYFYLVAHQVKKAVFVALAVTMYN